MATLEKVTVSIEATAHFLVWSGMYKGERVAVKFLQKMSEESVGEIKQELGFLG